MPSAIRVLLADDHELFRRGLAMLLGLEEDLAVVGEASDGPGSVSLAAREKPDVAMLDVRMPRGSGTAACRDVREVSPETQVIMLTSSESEADLFEAVRAGASGYLLKDTSIDEVAQAIRVVAAGESLITPSMAAKLLEEFKQMAAPAPQVGVAKLTARESEVLTLMARGRHNRQIAEELFIAENTVKNHVSNILDKLHLSNRTEAVLYALREKLVDLS